MSSPIIHKRYKEHSTVWVSQNYLTTHTEVNDVYLRVRARPYFKKNSSTWRWKKEDQNFYYDYERLPKKHQQRLGDKNALISLAGSAMPKEQIKVQAKENLKDLFDRYDEQKNKAIAWYSQAGYSKESLMLSKAFTWSKLLCDYTDKTTKLYIRLGVDKILDVYECVAELVQEGDIKALKVSSTTALYNKLKGFAHATTEEQYRWFLHKNKGNDHRAVLNGDMKNAIIRLRGLGFNWSDQAIVRKLQQLASVMGWNTPSERTIETYMNTKYVQTICETGRFGVRGRYRKYSQGSIPIALPLFAGDCWQMDGTRVNMKSHKVFDSSGKLIGEKHLFIVAVRDVYSGAMIGWSYGYSENHAMYINALMMAVERTGYLPYEIVSDRFPGHNKKTWVWVEKNLERLGVKITRTTFATGKAQMERAFGTLQSVFMSESLWYYGEGIKSKRRHAHRSEDYLKTLGKVVKQIGWDFDKSCDETDGILDRYNTTAISDYSRKNIDLSPMELQEQSSCDNVLRLKSWQMQWIFGVIKSIEMRGAGMLQIDLNKQTYHFRIEDKKVIIGQKKVVVSCDVRDMRTINVYDFSGNILCAAYEVAPIQKYGPNAENGRLQKERSKNKRFDLEMQAEYGKVVDDVQELMPNEMALLMPNTTQKSVLEKAETSVLNDIKKQVKCLPKYERDKEEEDVIIDEDISNPLKQMWGV